MQGNLSQISLSELLLLTTTGKQSGVWKLAHGKETVEVDLTDGQIIHAACPIGEGEKALLYPVTWDEGTFNLLPNGAAPAATVKKSSSEILDEVKAMTREWKPILEVIPSGKAVFRIADLPADNTGPITVPNVGWRVLSKLDGAHSVQESAEMLRIPFAYAAKVIYSLHKAGLVEPAATAGKVVREVVSSALLNRLKIILTEVMGPMAPLVLRDQIEALGESAEAFPEAKLDELLTLVGREISDGKLKQKFEESMFQEISNFKRF